MTDEIFSKGIGSKEGISLSAKPVQVQGIKAESVKGAEGKKNAGKEVGKKLILICKHPDKEEALNMSNIAIRTGNAIKYSTIWINLDADGNIQKGSLVALLLTKYNVATINDLVGKMVETELDGKFLTIKAY
jgi:hypothetical protein